MVQRMDMDGKTQRAGGQRRLYRETCAGVKVCSLVAGSQCEWREVVIDVTKG
jgi:hypothetical protein